MVCGTSPRQVTEGNRVLPRVCGCAYMCTWVSMGVGACSVYSCVGGCARACVLSCGDIPSLTVTWLPMTVQLGLFKEFNTLSVMYEDLSENFIEQKPPYSVVKDSAPDGSLKAGAVT